SCPAPHGGRRLNDRPATPRQLRNHLRKHPCHSRYRNPLVRSPSAARSRFPSDSETMLSPSPHESRAWPQGHMSPPGTTPEPCTAWSSSDELHEGRRPDAPDPPRLRRRGLVHRGERGRPDRHLGGSRFPPGGLLVRRKNRSASAQCA